MVAMDFEMGAQEVLILGVFGWFLFVVGACLSGFSSGFAGNCVFIIMTLPFHIATLNHFGLEKPQKKTKKTRFMNIH